MAPTFVFEDDAPEDSDGPDVLLAPVGFDPEVLEVDAVLVTIDDVVLEGLTNIVEDAKTVIIVSSGSQA